MAEHRDVIVIGGGVIGLTTAFLLARDSGLRVMVIERGEPGKEASWAGAGILPPARLDRATTPFNRLLGLSIGKFATFSAELRERTGIDNGYRVCGGFELVSGVTEALLETWRAERIAFERMNSSELRRIEPALSPTLEDGFYFREMAQVRNPRHLRALLAACTSLGVEILHQTTIRGFQRTGDRIRGVVSEHGSLAADRFLIACGAWSDELLCSFVTRPHVYPLRGQIVLFHPGRRIMSCIVNQGKNYLVPREDGRILAGSTEEEVGFVKETTTEGIANLTQLAQTIVPDLTRVPIETAWAGLRPATRDELPYLGPVPGVANLFVAAGHFRSGLMLSPGTGQVMAELVTGRPPSVPLEAFALDRPAKARGPNFE